MKCKINSRRGIWLSNFEVVSGEETQVDNIRSIGTNYKLVDKSILKLCYEFQSNPIFGGLLAKEEITLTK